MERRGIPHQSCWGGVIAHKTTLYEESPGEGEEQDESEWVKGESEKGWFDQPQ